MQSLMQHIFSQTIDSYLCFPQRFSDFFWKSSSLKTNQKLLLSFWSEIYKKCQNLLFCFQVQFLSPSFCGLIQGQDKLLHISNLVISLVPYGFPRLNSFCHTAVLPMKVKDESPYCCYVILQVSKCFRLSSDKKL